MYTQCPECGTVFRVTAAVLRAAQAQVRCGVCDANFNALRFLSDELDGSGLAGSAVAASVAPPPPSPAPPPPPATRSTPSADETRAFEQLAHLHATPGDDATSETDDGDPPTDYNILEPEDVGELLLDAPAANPAAGDGGANFEFDAAPADWEQIFGAAPGATPLDLSLVPSPADPGDAGHETLVLDPEPTFAPAEAPAAAADSRDDEIRHAQAPGDVMTMAWLDETVDAAATQQFSATGLPSADATHVTDDALDDEAPAASDVSQDLAPQPLAESATGFEEPPAPRELWADFFDTPVAEAVAESAQAASETPEFAMGVIAHEAPALAEPADPTEAASAPTADAPPIDATGDEWSEASPDGSDDAGPGVAMPDALAQPALETPTEAGHERDAGTAAPDDVGPADAAVDVVATSDPATPRADHEDEFDVDVDLGAVFTPRAAPEDDSLARTDEYPLPDFADDPSLLAAVEDATPEHPAAAGEGPARDADVEYETLFEARPDAALVAEGDATRDATRSDAAEPVPAEDAATAADFVGTLTAAGVAAPGTAPAPWADGDEFRRRDPSPRPVAPPAAIAAAVLLALGLVMQLVHQARESLVDTPVLGPPLAALYGALGAPIEPRWNLGSYEVRQWGAGSDATPGTLRLRASIVNRAGRAQPFPLLRVVLEDRFGGAVARREFRPVEYLPGHATPATLLAAGARADADLRIVDPGSEVVGFELDVCLERHGALTCGTDPRPPGG